MEELEAVDWYEQRVDATSDEELGAILAHNRDKEREHAAIPHAVARAIEVLRDAGVGGPYAVALGSNTYTGVTETTEKGGYPVLEHLRLKRRAIVAADKP